MMKMKRRIKGDESRQKQLDKIPIGEKRR